METIKPRNLTRLHKSALQRAFTLIELLVVIGIMLIMLAVAVPALTGISKSSDLTKAATDMSGVLEQARAYAMGKNTYVWVGFFNADDNIAATAAPGGTGQATGDGRVTVCVIASKDGTRLYKDTAPVLGVNELVRTVQLGKLSHFRNIYLQPLNGVSTTLDDLSPPRPAVADSLEVGHTTFSSGAVSFYYPLPVPVNPLPAGPGYGAGAKIPPRMYTFTKIIEITPRGEFAKVGGVAEQWFEIGLVPTHGIVVPGTANQDRPNIAAIQIAGITGAIRTYRP